MSSHENIWFVQSKTSYSGEKIGCHDCGDGWRMTTTECEDSARILFNERVMKASSREDSAFGKPGVRSLGSVVTP